MISGKETRDDSVLYDILPESEKERLAFFISQGHDPVAERLRFTREIRDRLKERKKVEIEHGVVELLEIGTGRGFFTVALAEDIPYSHVTSVDISMEQIEKARSILCGTGFEERVTFILTDAATLDLGGDAFHAAASYVSMHHMEDAGPVLRAMLQAAGGARGEGIVAIADYTAEGLRMLAESRERFGHGGGHGHREVPAEELEKVIENVLEGTGRELDIIPGKYMNFYLF